MLQHLRVVNMGVLEDASIVPGPHFTVITGETGAGKTLLLGGLRLLMGARADSGLVGPAGDDARAEGLFSTDTVEIAVTRVLPKEGRSRAYVDGLIVSAEALGDKVAPLAEIVGQHDKLGLRKPSEVLGLVDASGDDILRSAKIAYQEAWSELKRLRAESSRLGGDEMALRRELDLAKYQTEEIDAAGLEPGEDDLLEQEASRLRNIEEIREHLVESARHLEDIQERAGEIVSRLRKVTDMDPSSGHLSSASEELAGLAQELARSSREFGEALEGRPDRLAEVEHRLDTLGGLKRKYGRTLEDVVSFGGEVSARAGEIEALLQRADSIGAETARVEEMLLSVSSELTRQRLTSAHVLAEQARRHLSDLGLTDAILEVRAELVEPGSSGCDRVEIVFASDPRLDAVPVGTGASGGELSRLVLAMRLASSGTTGGTLVFDEIDTGIGGATALAMGRKLADLARTAQVVCVTHLPQVAAHADKHYVVTREGHTAVVSEVTDDERVREITRMLAGLPESEAGVKAADELLAAASRQ